MKNNKAFTLLELLIVIAIIGLLSTIITVSLRGAKAKAQDASIVAHLHEIRTAGQVHFTEHGNYNNLFNDDTEAKKIMDEIIKITTIINESIPQAYCVQAEAKTSGSYCLDSTGRIGKGTCDANLCNFTGGMVGPEPSGLPYIIHNDEKLYIYPKNSFTGFSWCSLYNGRIGPMAQSDIDGKSNTIAIVNGCMIDAFAAKICSDLIDEYEGHSDWFLPAKDQLYQMYLNRNYINKGAYEEEWEDFRTDNIYWSSTESIHSPDRFALYVSFNNGSQAQYLKDLKYRIRCVRID